MNSFQSHGSVLNHPVRELRRERTRYRDQVDRVIAEAGGQEHPERKVKTQKRLVCWEWEMSENIMAKCNGKLEKPNKTRTNSYCHWTDTGTWGCYISKCKFSRLCEAKLERAEGEQKVKKRVGRKQM